jgi:hypothetical protein
MDAMRTLLYSLCITSVLFAADDPWAKVKDLKSGTELRVYKKGSAQPLNVKMGDVTDENLIVVMKNEETAIARDLIDRIDYRPSGKSRLSTASKIASKDTTGDPKAVIPAPNARGANPGTATETSTNLSVGSRPEFETVYRRPAPEPPAKH